jgi:hypothetical protein
MQVAKRFPPSVPAHRSADMETAVWVLIVVLLGVVWFAMVSLLHRVGG